MFPLLLLIPFRSARAFGSWSLANAEVPSRSQRTAISGQSGSLFRGTFDLLMAWATRVPSGLRCPSDNLWLLREILYLPLRAALGLENLERDGWRSP
jgi:hypothetical protein